MECKYCVSACCAAEPVAELIDTLWNVNKDYSYHRRIDCSTN